MNASVIIPLYVYPSAGAWDPVYEMVLSYPRVQFTAIVNPHSGPGEGMLPNEDYLQAIQTLNSFSNVRTIGYVATTWFKRDLSSVLQDIAVYAGWGNHDSSLAMSGVFFDEIPTGYSSELVSYLQTISKAVHNSHGLRDGYVVLNPGALPEAQYFDDPEFVGTADLTVIFEDTFCNWIERAKALSKATEGYDSGRLALMMHSVSQDHDSNTDTTLQQILAVGHSVWITESTNYTEFGSLFPSFVASLNGLLT